MELAIALPADSWSEPVLSDPGRLLSRVAVYDSTWEPLESELHDWIGFQRDALGRLVGVWRYPGVTDSLIVGLETEDLDGVGRAAGYFTVSGIEDPGQGPLLSDVACLRDLEFNPDNTATRYRRLDGAAVPNPGRRYLVGEPLGLGFEAYHLQPDADGVVRARITVSVARATRRGLMRVLLGSGESRESLRFQAESSDAVVQQLIALNIPDMRTGEYQLHLVVEDAATGRTAERTVDFEVVSAP